MTKYAYVSSCVEVSKKQRYTLITSPSESKVAAPAIRNEAGANPNHPTEEEEEKSKENGDTDED